MNTKIQTQYRHHCIKYVFFHFICFFISLFLSLLSLHRQLPLSHLSPPQATTALSLSAILSGHCNRRRYAVSLLLHSYTSTIHLPLVRSTRISHTTTIPLLMSTLISVHNNTTNTPQSSSQTPPCCSQTTITTTILRQWEREERRESLARWESGRWR